MDVGDLYQELILDHNKSPRNFGKLDTPSRHAEGYNPLCGDQLTLDLELEGGEIRNIAFAGMGCAISTASASLMTEAVKGKTIEEAEALFHRFHQLIVGKPPAAEPAENAEIIPLGKLEALSGVAAYPNRIKCATLAWHTLHAALTDTAEPVTTE